MVSVWAGCRRVLDGDLKRHAAIDRSIALAHCTCGAQFLLSNSSLGIWDTVVRRLKCLEFSGERVRICRLQRLGCNSESSSSSEMKCRFRGSEKVVR